MIRTDRERALLYIEPFELLAGLKAAARHRARKVAIGERGDIQIFDGDGHEPVRLVRTLKASDVLPHARDQGGPLDGRPEEHLEALRVLLNGDAEGLEDRLREASAEQIMRAALGALVAVQHGVMR